MMNMTVNKKAMAQEGGVKPKEQTLEGREQRDNGIEYRATTRLIQRLEN